MKKTMPRYPHLGLLYRLFPLKYCTAIDNDPTWLKTDLQIYKAKTIIYKKPQSFYWNHCSWNENIMSVCFRRVSYSAVGVSPLFTWAKRTICSQQPEKSFCHFANLQKGGEKKDTKSLALWEKIVVKIFTRFPLLATIFSVAHFQGCGNSSWNTLILYGLGNSNQITYLHLALVCYMHNVSTQYCFKDHCGNSF